MGSSNNQAVMDFLETAGARTIEHPGGTLLAHLGRTRDRLAAWGADDDVQLLGLAHAIYGTDGLALNLLGLGHGEELTALVGPVVEQQIYLYASCDRRATYPHLADRPTVSFQDRFTGQTRDLPATDLTGFAMLTAANELDVLLNSSEPIPGHREWLLRLVTKVRDLLTDRAWTDCTHALATK
jgi:hypothetical protein